MPTPSEPQRLSEFGVGSSPPRRSIFGNYKPESFGVPPSGGETIENSKRDGHSGALPAGAGASNSLQSSIDTAVARAFIYRLLAKALEDPVLEGWQWLSSQPTKSALWSAVQPLAPTAPAAFACAAAGLASQLTPDGFEDFHHAYVTCFGHTVRGDCPMNEIEYGDIKADPLFQPHRLADLAAFYAAFGLEMTPDAAERQDHISIELEFMCVLTAKEAYALEHQLDDEQVAICRDAQKKFLREHLSRWTPAFTRRLARMAGDSSLGALADFAREFITEDCARFKVTPGSEDLLLRPIDESSESLCASCGITNLPPGATGSLVEA
ncbi:MAG: molecular chaperone TorD family protein [Verrucomicrobia bacterium]|nr:molecular chaperone TorD family protein [Verrucomicrobiota bacterium]